MESSIVIKIKYGETLRRFNVRVVDQELDLDMNELRNKVLSLFNFSPDAELTLTYIDEDGDIVTLADQEDLYDVMRQSLNPLRISVRVNTERSGKSYNRSSGDSAMRSPRVQPPFQKLNSSVSKIIKSVPEGIHETLLRLSTRLASKSTTLPPGYSELIDSLSKMGLTYLKEVSVLKSGSSESNSNDPGTMDQNCSNVDGAASESSLPNAELKSKQADLRNLTGLPEGMVLPAAEVEDPHTATSDKFFLGSSSGNTSPFPYDVSGDDKKVKDKAKNKIKVKKVEEHLGIAKSTGSFVQGSRVPTNSPGGKMKDINRSWKSFAASSSVKPGALDSGLGGSKETKLAADYGNGKVSQFGLGERPLSGASVAPHQYAPPMGPFKRSYSHSSDGFGSIFHRGVRCDGCGVHPITGPRFKSKLKMDYDLCSICFDVMGDEADFIRMDHPSHPSSFNGFYNPMQHSRGHPQISRLLFRRPSGLPKRPSGLPKLDSQFIQDVNILDNTIMAPLMQFTKIWRMRNNGTVAWPRGTQLRWIGGNMLSKTITAELEIPAGGVPVDNEIDISIDFNAPENPGWYISYWRMASPSGQMFGQHVWSLIQVDTSFKDSSSENVHAFNLNLPPVSSAIMGPQMDNMSVQPMAEDSLLEATELVEPLVDVLPNRDQELNFPINDTLLLEGPVANLRPLESSPVSYPIVDLSEVAVTGTSPQRISNTVVASSVEEFSGNNEVELALLKELEEMGFKQVDLNKDILRTNEYNLEQSVDELCGVAEWDPILEELQEMGFRDEEMNKMLLKKNNGSIKRVVMDLITGEKA